jgi:hypothetical protein
VLYLVPYILNLGTPGDGEDRVRAAHLIPLSFGYPIVRYWLMDVDVMRRK